MLIGSLMAAAGYAMLLVLGDASPYAAMVPAFVVIPMGMGLAVPAMTTCVLASVKPEHAGIGTAALNAAQADGGRNRGGGVRRAARPGAVADRSRNARLEPVRGGVAAGRGVSGVGGQCRATGINPTTTPSRWVQAAHRAADDHQRTRG